MKTRLLGTTTASKPPQRMKVQGKNVNQRAVRLAETLPSLEKQLHNKMAALSKNALVVKTYRHGESLGIEQLARSTLQGATQVMDSINRLVGALHIVIMTAPYALNDPQILSDYVVHQVIPRLGPFVKNLARTLSNALRLCGGDNAYSGVATVIRDLVNFVNFEFIHAFDNVVAAPSK